jgi:hypothetical protein
MNEAGTPRIECPPGQRLEDARGFARRCGYVRRGDPVANRITVERPLRRTDGSVTQAAASTSSAITRSTKDAARRYEIGRPSDARTTSIGRSSN